MDLAVRLSNVITNNTGFFLFIKAEQPAAGFIVVKRVQTYRIADFQPGEAVTALRSFFVTHALRDDGIACWRRSGNLTLGIFKYFPTQAEAEVFARTEGHAYIVNITDRSVIQVGDFIPDVPANNI